MLASCSMLKVRCQSSLVVPRVRDSGEAPRENLKPVDAQISDFRPGTPWKYCAICCRHSRVIRDACVSREASAAAWACAMAARACAIRALELPGAMLATEEPPSSAVNCTASASDSDDSPGMSWLRVSFGFKVARTLPTAAT